VLQILLLAEMQLPGLSTLQLAWGKASSEPLVMQLPRHLLQKEQPWQDQQLMRVLQHMQRWLAWELRMKRLQCESLQSKQQLHSMLHLRQESSARRPVHALTVGAHRNALQDLGKCA